MGNWERYSSKDWEKQAFKNCRKQLSEYNNKIIHYKKLINNHGEIKDYKFKLELYEKLYGITLQQIKVLNKSDLEILIEIIIDKIKNIFKQWRQK